MAPLSLSHAPKKKVSTPLVWELGFWFVERVAQKWELGGGLERRVPNVQVVQLRQQDSRRGYRGDQHEYRQERAVCHHRHLPRIKKLRKLET